PLSFIRAIKAVAEEEALIHSSPQLAIAIGLFAPQPTVVPSLGDMRVRKVRPPRPALGFGKRHTEDPSVRIRRSYRTGNAALRAPARDEVVAHKHNVARQFGARVCGLVQLGVTLARVEDAVYRPMDLLAQCIPFEAGSGRARA